MPSSTLLPWLCDALTDSRLGDSRDDELLARFHQFHDEAAFTALLRRHGPMVLDVCRSLPNAHDAEDAFQSTFLTLARSAGSIRETGTLAAWLHGVALRTTLKARAQYARRRKHETSVPLRTIEELEDPTWGEIRQVLHEELGRLSERHRGPLVLCYLQGQTQDRAASLLGLSKTTLKRRLEAGRTLLRDRLIRRGVGATGAVLVASWPAAASATVPATLVRSTMASLTPATATSLPWKLLILVALAFGTAAVAITSTLTRPAPAEATSALAADRPADPLPQNVVARLGSDRFRSDAWINQVVVAPGGKTLLGPAAHAVVVWDAATGLELRRFEGPKWRQVKGTGFGVRIDAFAVSPDGQTLAAGTADGSRLECPILLFDLATGKKLGELAGHRGDVWSANHSLAFVTPTLLASAGGDGTARVWDVKSKREVCRLEMEEKNHLSTLITAPDGKHVFGVGSAGEAGFWGAWDVETGKRMHHQGGLPGTFHHIALSSDGKAVAVTLSIGAAQKEGGRNDLRLYSAPGWKEVRRWRTHDGPYPQRNSVAFSPDGKRLATGGADQRVRQWYTATGTEASPHIEPYQYANKVRYLDNDTLITFDAQSVLKFWDAKTGKPKLDFGGSEGHLTTLAYSPDGRHVVTGGGGGDATLRVWDVATSKQVAHLRSGMADVTCVQFSPDGKRLVSADSQGTARIWDWAANREVQTFRDHASWLYCAAFSPDGKQLATGDEAGMVRVWDLASGKAVHELRGHTGRLSACVFTPDGRGLFTCGWDHVIRLWDLTTGQVRWAIKGNTGVGSRDKPTGHTNVVTALGLSPGGQWLCSGSYDHLICTWEASTGRLARVLKSTERGYSSVNALSLSADGTQLAAAIGDDGQESSVHVWDVASGKKVAAWPGHRGKVSGLAYAPDGTRLASCSQDTTVLVWDVTKVARGAAAEEKPTWEDLGSTDPEIAYAAVCRAVAMKGAAARIKANLKPVGAVEETKVAAWVKLLDAETMAERDQASQALAGSGLGAVEVLKKFAGKAESAEVKARLARLLSDLGKEQQQALRAVEVLEMIGTKEAQEVLRDLARGADGELTREARVAWDRVERRKP